MKYKSYLNTFITYQLEPLKKRQKYLQVMMTELIVSMFIFDEPNLLSKSIHENHMQT